jgi:predicted type IV restriction endonuclease
MNLELLGKRAEEQKPFMKNEKATINVLIRSFIEDILGYNMAEPKEVFPELTCYGSTKSCAVDYAICKNYVPYILIECKRWNEDLKKEYVDQLRRYFSRTKENREYVKYLFAILTNGIEYRFYTDLDQEGVMDEQPFFALNIKDLKEDDGKIVDIFHRSKFEPSTARAVANQLKASGKIEDNKSAENPIFNTTDTSEYPYSNIYLAALEKVRTVAKSIDSTSTVELGNTKDYAKDYVSILYNKKPIISVIYNGNFKSEQTTKKETKKPKDVTDDFIKEAIKASLT